MGRGYGTKGALYQFFWDLDDCESNAESIVLKSVIQHDTKKWTKDDWDNFTKQANAIYIEIVHCLNAKLEPKSEKVQNAIKNHCEFSGKFHKITHEVYLALAELYNSKEEYKEQIAFFHPELCDYLTRAMYIYAYNDLKN